MARLGCSREEAVDIIRCDEEIDLGGELFEQTPEQKKATKEALGKMGDHKKRTYHREHVVDPAKRSLLDDFKIPLVLRGAEIIKEQTETEITFLLNGDRFTLKLTKHRPPKANKGQNKK